MAYVSGRFEPLRRLAAASALCAGLIGLGAAAYGLVAGRAGYEVAAWAFTLGGVAVAALSLGAFCLLMYLHRLVDTLHRTYDRLIESNHALHRQSEWLKTIAESSSQSEWAKRLIFRERDHAYLRDSIYGLIVQQDWSGAEHLIAALAAEFGDDVEAARLRGELAKARASTAEERAAAALERFEQLCETRQWARAAQEIERMQALFPGNARIAGLVAELEDRHQAHKRQLLTHYDEAVRTQDFERAHDLLFELDKYLSPHEAAGLRHSARGVFRAKLHQLGVKFSLAINDKKFGEALETGQALIQEFPNTRYTREIRQMMPMLQRRATTATVDVALR